MRLFPRAAHRLPCRSALLRQQTSAEAKPTVCQAEDRPPVQAKQTPPATAVCRPVCAVPRAALSRWRRPYARESGRLRKRSLTAAGAEAIVLRCGDSTEKSENDRPETRRPHSQSGAAALCQKARSGQAAERQQTRPARRSKCSAGRVCTFFSACFPAQCPVIRQNRSSVLSPPRIVSPPLRAYCAFCAFSGKAAHESETAACGSRNSRPQPRLRMPPAVEGGGTQFFFSWKRLTSSRSVCA